MSSSASSFSAPAAQALLAFTVGDVAACLELMEKAEPTTHMTQTAYTMLPEVLLRLLLNSRAVDNDSTRAQLGTMLDQSMSYLAKYTDHMSSARPRLAIYRGISALLSGKKKDVEKHFKDAVDSASELQMLCDHALALYYRAAFVPAKDSAKLAEQSRDIFKSLGVTVPTVADVQPPFIDQWRINAALHKMSK